MTLDLDQWTKLDVDTIRFAFPAAWQTEIERNEEETTVFLQSDSISFAIVGVYPLDLEPDEILGQVLDSVRAEHPGLEVDTVELDLRRWPDGVACEGMFMTLDTVAYAWARCWRIGDRSVLVYLQSVERESGDCEEVFEAICLSITCESQES